MRNKSVHESYKYSGAQVVADLLWLAVAGTMVMAIVEYVAA